MGYTHYWTQRRNFTKVQWQQASTDLMAICKHAQHVEGIPLANGMGDGGTQPEFTADHIALNGLGDDGHETLYLTRRREDDGGAFCKTARKPYDVVVTACLCYLATITRRDDPATHEPIIGSEQYEADSDGHGKDWLAGLDLARAALPQYANLLDIPMGVMKKDRWCAPWVNYDRTGRYEVRFCVDGHGYVLRGDKSYRFETHEALAKFLDRTKAACLPGWRPGHTGWGSYPASEPDIWNAYGSFDKARTDRLRRAQERVLEKLFHAPSENWHQPPAYVRPGEMPENAGRTGRTLAWASRGLQLVEQIGDVVAELPRSDEWKCPDCGATILVGHAGQPFAQDFQGDDGILAQKRAGADKINDC